MPKTRPDKEAEAFGRRLVQILEAAGQPRRGAGAYLAKRYKVSTVTANAWLNGEHRAETSQARRIAEDHSATFDYLYFGKNGHQDSESHPEKLDTDKLAKAQKFLEDLFDAEQLEFVPSQQTLLLAAVYNELLLTSEPNMIEMVTRYGRQVRGEHERQGAVRSAGKDDRGRTGERSQEKATAERRKVGSG